MERLEFIDDNGEKTQFYVIEETRINGINYLLVSESDDENCCNHNSRLVCCITLFFCMSFKYSF